MVKYRSSKLAQKKKKEFRIKLALVLVIFISFVFTLSALSKCDLLNIKKIKVVGNNIVKENQIKETVSATLDNDYFKLFSKRNFLIYPRQTIKEGVVEKFKRIKSVDLSLKLPDVLYVSVVERVPYVLWCADASSTKCYVADSEGYIFAEGVDNVFAYHTNSSRSVGQNIFSADRFKGIDSFVQFLVGLGLEPYKFVETGGKYEIYFGSRESKIIFNEEQGVKEVMENLQSVLNMEEFTDIEDFKKLEYIDLRFGNKVFYK